MSERVDTASALGQHQTPVASCCTVVHVVLSSLRNLMSHILLPTPGCIYTVDSSNQPLLAADTPACCIHKSNLFGSSPVWQRQLEPALMLRVVPLLVHGTNAGATRWRA